MSGKDWLRFWALGLVWGTSFLWIKVAVSEISPALLVGFRTLFGMLGLVAVLAASRVMRSSRESVRRALFAYALIGLFNVAVPFTLISWAEQYIDSGLASILNSTVPLFSMVIAPFFLKDDPFTLRKFTGLLIGFAGVFLVISPEFSQGVDSSLLGQAAMLLAALSYAGATVLARRSSQGLTPAAQAFLQLSFATIYMWAFTLITERPLHLPELPLTWLALLWLGFLGSCVAYLLYFALLRSIGPTRTTMVTYLLPLFGVALGAIFLGERIYITTVLGGLLIVSGIAFVNVRSQAKAKPA